MINSQTKQLPEGIPVVDSNGTVTPMSIADVATAVGKLLGVHTAKYLVKGSGWVRIAAIHTSACVLLISNLYGDSPSAGIVLSVCGGYYSNLWNVKYLGGTTNIFDKVRLVGANGTVFLEVYSCVAGTGSNNWFIKLLTDRADRSLNQSITAGQIEEGYDVKEYTLTSLKSGGVKPTLSINYKSVAKGGWQHECANKESHRASIHIRPFGSSWNLPERHYDSDTISNSREGTSAPCAISNSDCIRRSRHKFRNLSRQRNVNRETSRRNDNVIRPSDSLQLRWRYLSPALLLPRFGSLSIRKRFKWNYKNDNTLLRCAIIRKEVVAA